MTTLPPLRYLTGADVTAAMPALDARLELAALTLRGLAGTAELPPKIGVHPTPAGSFAHAMPAFMPGDPGGSAGAGMAADGLGMKWVLGFPGNNALGLPAVQRDPAPQRPRDRRPDRDPRRRPDHRATDRRDLGRGDPGLGAGGRRPRPPRGPHRGRRAGREPRRGARPRAARRRAVHLRHGPRPGGRARHRGPDDARHRRCRGRAVRARRGRRRRRRRQHRLVPAPGAAPDDDDGLARPGHAGRAGRLRHVLLGRGRPRRVAVRRRPPRAVPRQPRRRPVRRLPGPHGDDGRGPRVGRRSPGRDGSSRPTSAPASPTSCSGPRSSRRPPRWASGRSCRAERRET